MDVNNQNNSRPKSVKKKSRDVKIIIVGDSGTGKTSFVNQYILHRFEEVYQATIATQFSSKILEIDNIIYRLQFWDIAGQDRSPETTKIFCKDSNGIVICCEVNNNKTRENTKQWKQSLEANMNLDNIPIIIIENKCDLLGDNEEDYNKDIEELKKFCEENKIRNCFRTSAMKRYGVEESMSYLIKEILKASNFNEVYEEEESIRETITLNEKPHYSVRGNKSKCC